MVARTGSEVLRGALQTEQEFRAREDRHQGVFDTGVKRRALTAVHEELQRARHVGIGDGPAVGHLLQIGNDLPGAGELFALTGRMTAEYLAPTRGIADAGRVVGTHNLHTGGSTGPPGPRIERLQPVVRFRTRSIYEGDTDIVWSRRDMHTHRLRAPAALVRLRGSRRGRRARGFADRLAVEQQDSGSGARGTWKAAATTEIKV